MICYVLIKTYHYTPDQIKDFTLASLRNISNEGSVLSNKKILSPEQAKAYVKLYRERMLT